MKQKVFRLQLHVADDLVEKFFNAKANAEQDVVTLGRRVSQGHSRLIRGQCAVCGNKKKPDGTRKDTKMHN